MSAWSARTYDGSHHLLINTDVLRTLDRLCAGAGSIETGGVLVGRYSENFSTAVVLEATAPPQDSCQGPAWFERGIAGLRDLLQQRWQSSERSYYLGEWHFHPATVVKPSWQDIAQMDRICDDPRYQCREPLLLILGMLKNGQRRAAQAFVFPRGEHYKEFGSLSKNQWDSHRRPLRETKGKT